MLKQKKTQHKMNIGLVVFIRVQASVEPCFNLINIISDISDDIYIILVYNDRLIIPKLGETPKFCKKIVYNPGKNILNDTINYLITQLRISYLLLKASNKKEIDSWIFFMGETSVLPVMMLKLLKRHITLPLTGSLHSDVRLRRYLLATPLILFNNICFAISDKIILYSSNLIKEWHLEKYINKISIAHRHFIDFDQFKVKKKYAERDNLVGYIGRLSEEKGVLNFVKAIPEISGERSKIKFLVGGDGRLRDEIEKYLGDEKLDDKIKLVGWIPHDKLSDYLNDLKLVVLPSYTEGLPNIMLEAMACNTPVLATPVGAIPDIITDSETGFIMEDNSPACVAENVMRALKHPDLEMIIENARALVEREYTYEAAVKRYRKILKELQ